MLILLDKNLRIKDTGFILNISLQMTLKSIWHIFEKVYVSALVYTNILQNLQNVIKKNYYVIIEK